MNILQAAGSCMNLQASRNMLGRHDMFGNARAVYAWGCRYLKDIKNWVLLRLAISEHVCWVSEIAAC